jgi:hypothetical protein
LRQADEVVEIDRLVGREPLLVALHDARGDAIVIVGRGAFGLCAVQALVLPQADRPLPAARERIVRAAARVLQDREHVVAVEDAELRLQSQPLALAAQDAHAQRMEGADDEVLGRARADQLLGALAHLGGGLVGEGDRGDLPGA